MKRGRFFSFNLLLVSLLFVSSTFAQNSPQWHLPKGAKVRLGKSWISDIAYSPNGNFMAVGTVIGIWIYDVHSGAEVTLLTGHTDGVTSIAFSPDGTTLASGGNWGDETVRLWDVATWRPKVALTGHKGSIDCVVFSPDSTMLASGGSDKVVQLWDARTGQPMARLVAHTRWISSIAFSPDGTTLASGGGWGDDTVLLWDTTTLVQDTITGDTKATLKGHANGVESVVFSPDGTMIASGGSRNDGTVRLWGARTGRLITTLTGYTNWGSNIAFSPDGTTLATGGGSNDETIQLWYMTGELKATLRHTGSIGNIAFSPDGTTLASVAGSKVHLWDAQTGQFKTIFAEHTGGGSSVAFSPDGTTLATGSGRIVQLWDAATWQPEGSLTGHTDTVRTIAFSPDGATLASGSSDHTVRLWDVTTGQLKTVLIGHTYGVNSVAFSPDGTTLATGNGQWDRTLRLWDVPTGQQYATFMRRLTSIESVAFSPDGTTLASGNSDGTIQLWDPVTGRHKATIAAHTDFIRDIAFSPDGRTLAIGGQELATSDRTNNHTVRLLDVATGQRQATLAAHRWDAFGVTFSLDGRTLVSGGSDNMVRLWDVLTGQLKATLVGHTGSVRSVAFSPDGATLASGSHDGTVLIWEFTPSTKPGDVNHDGVVSILDLTFVGSNLGRTGQHDADINGDGVVDILDLVKVAAVFSETIIPTAPIAFLSPDKGKRGNLSNLNRDIIQGWVDMAHAADDGSLTFRRGTAFLEQLLAVLPPQETVLLSNYPNPFNPETWIPYRLAKDADVTFTIYDTKGVVIRQFDLGHQLAGDYTDRARAAYWDGTSDIGELVASGVYFYSLSAGNYSATRKMLILK